MDIKRILASAPRKHDRGEPAQLTTPWGEAIDPARVRAEHPHPQFAREGIRSLNGWWQYAIVPTLNAGESWARMRPPARYDGRILVPVSPEAPLSGVGRTVLPTELLWYRRAFALPEDWAGKRVLLHFGAVDYTCKVWVNGALAGGHTGGHAGFSLDVTEALRPGENVLTVLAEDDHADREMPRGKQYWGEKPRSIFYTPTSGIWQTVWLEPVSEDRLLSVRVTPDLAGRQVFFDYELSRPGLVLTAAAACPDGAAVSARSDGEARGRLVLSLDRDGLDGGAFADQYAWSPEHPVLFQTVYEVRAEAEVTVKEGMPVLCNVSQVIEGIRQAADKVLGEGHVQNLPTASPGSDDFACYLDHAPGALFRMGTGSEDPAYHIGLHNGRNLFDEQGIGVGAAVIVQYLLDFLH